MAIFASIGIFQAFDTIDLWFQAQVQSKHTVFAKNIAFAIVTISKLILIQIQAPLIIFAWINLLESVLAAICLFVIYFRKYPLQKWQPRVSLAKTLIKESWPLILSSLSIMIYVKIDQIMLGVMVGDKAVGIYSAATRISEVWYFIPTAISSSVSPSIFCS